MSLLHDLRHGLRGLRAKPGFTLLVLIALAFGIGLNTALFTVVNSLILRPLPYDRPDRLVEVLVNRRSIPLAELNAAKSFSGAAVFNSRGFSVTESGEPRNRYGFRVSPNLFDVLGVQPILGRAFISSDQNQPVVILGYEYWRRTSGSPAVVGQSIALNNTPHTILGVLPADFGLQVRDGNVFVPYPMTEGRIIARLQPGATQAEANAEVAALLGGLPPEPGPRPRIEQTKFVTGLDEGFRPGSAQTLLLWQAAVLFVLLITCANVANLMLVRSAARRREFAIRSAIGAGRVQLMRQLLVESALLAFGGGVLGLVLAAWTVGYLGSVLPANIGRYLRGAESLSVDGRVLAFVFLASLTAVLLCGLAPAISAFRLDLISCLRDASKGTAPTRQRLGRMFVVAEVALALMLLIAAGLTLRSLAKLEKVNLGFSADRVLRATVELTPQRFPTPEARTAAFDNMITRVGAMTGVESVSLLAPQLFPFGGPQVRGAIFEIQGRPGGEPRAETYIASPDYFRTVRIPLLRGRLFKTSDAAGAQPVVILSDVVAKRYWPDDDPTGRSIRVSSAGGWSPWLTIVGVVGDVRNPVGADLQPTVYRPLPQAGSSGAMLLVRAEGDSLAIAPAVRSTLRAIDPEAPDFRIAELDRAVASYIDPQRFATSLLGFFAIAGLLLASLGVYGVTRYWVVGRIAEIGVRVALGASRRDVLMLVIRRALVTAIIGIALGIAGALALHRVIASQLYGVSATDPATFVLISVLMGLTVVVAALLPARWAARVDPLVALRHE